MVDAIEFTLDDGTAVAIASASRSGSSSVGIPGRLEAAEKTLRQSLKPVTSAAEQAIASFRSMTRVPEDVEIAFGITFDAKFGGIITSANAGATLQVTLRWHGSAAPLATGEAGEEAVSPPPAPSPDPAQASTAPGSPEDSG
jgi:Trypsin-co-occurring domain 1